MSRWHSVLPLAIAVKGFLSSHYITGRPAGFKNFSLSHGYDVRSHSGIALPLSVSCSWKSLDFIMGMPTFTKKLSPSLKIRRGIREKKTYFHMLAGQTYQQQGSQLACCFLSLTSPKWQHQE